MKKLLFIIILFFLSCNNDKPRIGVIEERDLTQTQIDSILNEYNFVYSDLTFIDSTSQVLLPITTQKNYEKRYSSYEYEAEDYPRYWNILFFNSDNDTTNLLINSKIRIADFECNIKNSGPILRNRILYKIGDKDYNKDKRLNYEDPLHLFISKIDGSELVRLSPLNENLESYKIVPKTDKIIFRTSRDIDSDLNFDKDDELIWYQIDLSEKNSLKEIVNPANRKLIEKLYFEQWLVKE
ncbi:hypothetical protein AWE51_23130 [Aquimarina aggregata]|uniref:Lipoprotein n=1 Tax=Aquimarina aggregata TaxID=1642818 RepID=A0A162CRF8_9FLAO|nr:hypothetical protein [Aquimarina aggregata]KZS41054.1 hypothetical protein AWE51_23130 [Aquimarina aggregata]